MQGHAVVVLDAVQAHPGHRVFAGHVVGVVRLMLMPEKGQCDFRHDAGPVRVRIAACGTLADSVGRGIPRARKPQAATTYIIRTRISIPARLRGTAARTPRRCGARTSPAPCPPAAAAASAVGCVAVHAPARRSSASAERRPEYGRTKAKPVAGPPTSVLRRRIDDGVRQAAGRADHRHACRTSGCRADSGRTARTGSASERCRPPPRSGAPAPRSNRGATPTWRGNSLAQLQQHVAIGRVAVAEHDELRAAAARSSGADLLDQVEPLLLGQPRDHAEQRRARVRRRGRIACCSAALHVALPGDALAAS